MLSLQTIYAERPMGGQADSVTIEANIRGRSSSSGEGQGLAKLQV